MKTLSILLDNFIFVSTTPIANVQIFVYVILQANKLLFHVSVSETLSLISLLKIVNELFIPELNFY